MELIRLLVKNQAEVQVVLTEAASHFVGEATFEALTRRKVAKNMWDSSNSTIAHIDLVDWADLIVVAPATANFIAKLRNGICDDLLSSLCAARKTPIIVAPAMNCFMWDNPANLENVENFKAGPAFHSRVRKPASKLAEITAKEDSKSRQASLRTLSGLLSGNFFRVKSIDYGRTDF